MSRRNYLCLVVVLTTANGGCSPSDYEASTSQKTDWPVYLGDSASSQYSTLKQINRSNVHELSQVWVYRTGDLWSEQFAQIQTNAIVRNGVLYGTSPEVDVFALDAATGEERWRFDPSSSTAANEHPATPYLGVSRGLAFWSDGKDWRIFVTRGSRLHALNATTGAPIRSFGDDGSIDLRDGLHRDLGGLYVGATTPGIVYKDLLIQGSRVGEGPHSAPGHVRAYDVRSGKIVWTFHTIPQPGEYGYDTWPEDAWTRVGGANSWAGMSLDESRGIVYVPTGSATFDFWGGDRHGANLFANCLIALSAKTGERLWHYQIVHHDIWDRDLPAPPNLLTVQRNGSAVDAVAQITKSGHVFLFDRVTGEPLFPIEERPVSSSSLRGEQTSPTQPFPVVPIPFARQRMTDSDINDLDPDTYPELLARFRGARSLGQFVPFDTNETVVFPGFDGGGEWGGAAVDPNGVLYVNANEMPFIASLADVEASGQVDATMSLGEATYTKNCAVCHGEHRQGGYILATPPLLDLTDRYSAEAVRDIVLHGRGFMPAYRSLGDTATDALVHWLLGRPEPELPDKSLNIEDWMNAPTIPYVWTGFERFVDANGYPGVKPPWGTLSAIDLNSGDYLWRITLGEMPELTAKGIPATGTENYGGPIVTAGGLVFIAATKDKMFRAFDKSSGELIWQTELPAAGFATPSTYMVNGRQFVVIAAGGGKIGQPSGDFYIAYALPQDE